MRLEQLVLYGPGDDDRLKFGPRVTVFAGLKAVDRMELIETIVDALTGRLSNASVVYTDANGRRVFADRTGATFADDGIAAPGPSELLGKDPSTVAGLLTLLASDLGLGQSQSPEELNDQIAAARSALEKYHNEHVQLVEQTDQVGQWRQEVVEIDRRLATADDDRARWTWLEHRRQLDEMRTELAMLDSGDGSTDKAILGSVDSLRTAGSAWADLAAAASEMRQELGPLPQVSADNIARVAATPDSPPATFLTRMEAWRAANEARVEAESELARVSSAPPAAADPVVQAFAEMDQQRLWTAHRRLTKAAEVYNAVTAADEDLPDENTEAELAVEHAHLEVVRAQRVVDERVRPGMVGALALVAGAVLALVAIHPVLAVVMLAGSGALWRWLVMLPKAALAEAEQAEEHALTHTDAGSWLGIHLRRLDEITDSADRKRFENAANNWVVAQVEWEEVAGDHTVDQLDAVADEVKARAESVNPKAIAKRRDLARQLRDTTAAAERSARAALAGGLEPFGFPDGALGSDVAPEALLASIERRIEAGRIARRAIKLNVLLQRERAAAQQLESILARLGFTDGDLESRLERAIQAVSVARQRQAVATGARDRTDLEAEIARLNVIVERTRRAGWTNESDMAGPPADPDLLEARRRELAELIGAAGSPDVVGAEHRYKVGLARVRDLEARVQELTKGPQSLEERVARRLSRTTVLNGVEESVPVLIDDAFEPLPFDEKVKLLDRLLGHSAQTQVIMLSDDEVVTRWARSRVGSEPVVLMELDSPAAPVEAALSSH